MATGLRWLKMAAASVATHRLRAVAAVLCVAGLPATGCSSPYAASTNKPLTSEEAGQKWVFEGRDNRQAKAALRLAAGEHVVVRPPQPASTIRWSDLDQAVAYACDDAEMAVVNIRHHPWGVEYQLLTIEDYPARLVVRRTDDERVYQASAHVGVFDDHANRAQRLLEALDTQMRAFARKRKFEE